MNSVSENLNRYFEGVMRQTREYDFFTFLAIYTNYIIETPGLQNIVNEVMKKKELEYEKLEQLEKRSLQELRKAKEELLKIIKDNNINQDSLQSRVSIFPWGSAGLLNELEQFESGLVSIGGFRSDNLEPYLFDIAVGISQQGRQDLVQEFIDPNRRPQNTHGNFVFSKTLNSRHEQTELIEQASRLELWGAFDHLIKFQKAYSEVCKNTHFMKVLDKYGNQSRNYLEGRDAVDITFATQDIRKILDIKFSRTLDNDLFRLKIPDYKLYAEKVNSHLLKELSKETSKKTEQILLYLDKNGNLWKEPKERYCYQMMEAKNRLNIIKILVKYQTKTSNYFPTEELAKAIGKNTEYVRSEKGKINRIAKNKLKLKLIDKKQGSGYRINPDIKIKILPR